MTRRRTAVALLLGSCCGPLVTTGFHFGGPTRDAACPRSSESEAGGRRCQSATSTSLWSSTKKEPSSVSSSKEEEKEEALSDVDARVLREMLQQSKLDLETEDDVRKLLERGTKKTVSAPAAPVDEYEDSIFESKAMQKFTDTKLWKALSAKTSDILESAKIWIGNKIEQDVKTLAALGLFAWDRAVRDVARALPAAGSGEQPLQFLLANTSSFVEQEQPPQPVTAESLREELNRPSDEIKSVSQAIWDILNGNADDAASGKSGRGLRTVAQAGTANMADRQRRAYRQSKKRREQDSAVQTITKLPGGLVDATYELQREMKSEINPAGYKTKPIRQAIEAGVVGTGKVLEGIKESARLAAAERKAKRLQAAAAASAEAAAAAAIPAAQEVKADVVVPESGASPQKAPEASRVPSPMTSEIPAKVDWQKQQQQQLQQEREQEVLLELQSERDAMLDRLMACITRPEETWLQSDLLTSEARTLSEESLREIATLMILLKDELNSASDHALTETVDSCLEQLRTDLRYVTRLRAKVAGTISMAIGNTLFDIVVGKYDAFETEPLFLRLDEIEQSLKEPPVVVVETQPQQVPESPQPSGAFFADFAQGAAAAAADTVRPASPVAPKEDVGSASPSYVDAEEVDDAWMDVGETVKYVEVEPDEEIPVVVSQGGSSSGKATVVDVVPESVFRAQSDVEVSVGDEAVVVDADTGSVFVAEVVSDDDFDTAVGEHKTVATSAEAVDGEEAEEEKPNLVMTTALRSLDVGFFVLEKVFIVAVPKTVMLASTAAQRLDEVNRSGKGRKGWEPIRGAANPKGRY